MQSVLLFSLIGYMAMKSFVLRNIVIPRVWLGTSPFIGAGQFGERAEEYYKRFYLNPDNMLAIMERAAELGWGIQSFIRPNLVSTIRTLKQTHPQVPCFFVCGMDTLSPEIETALFLEPLVLGFHASIADHSSRAERQQCLESVHNPHILTAFATHEPARTLPVLQRTSVDLLMVPLNKSGRLMGKNAHIVPESVRTCKKPIIAKKVFCAGTIDCEFALEYVVSLGVSGVCLGVTSLEELEKNHETLQNLDFI